MGDIKEVVNGMDKNTQAFVWLQTYMNKNSPINAQMTVSYLVELVQRATPMKPILRNLSVEFDCPICSKYVGWCFDKSSFCKHCGQCIDWSDE